LSRLGFLEVPSHYDIKVKVLDKERIELTYVERYPPTADEEALKILLEQTSSVLRTLIKIYVPTSAPDLKLETVPEKRELRATLTGKPINVYGFLCGEFLTAYLASGGGALGVMRMLTYLDALRRGKILVEKSLVELPQIKKAVILDEDVLREMACKSSVEDLLKIKRVVEQELRKREEEAPDE